jgi:hypothetical protein
LYDVDIWEMGLECSVFRGGTGIIWTNERHTAIRSPPQLYILESFFWSYTSSAAWQHSRYAKRINQSHRADWPNQLGYQRIG